MDAMGTTTVNLGELYFKKGDYETALSYFERSLQAFEQSSSGNVSYAMTSIGKVYSRLGNYQEAIDYQQRAFEIASDLESKPDMVLTLLGLAGTYRDKGDVRSSLEYYNRAGAIAKEIGAIYELRDAYGGMAQSYAGIADYRNAFDNLDQLLKINDTIFSELSQQQINKLRIQYEAEAIERENTLLKRDMELSEARDRNQMLVIYLFILGFVFTLVFIGLLYRSNNLKRKANRELKRKDEIKNEYVMRITHDIKGHLAAIKSSLDVLHSKPVESIREDCREFLDMASGRTKTLIKFVKDLLSISKLQLSSDIRSSPFSIRDSVDKTVSHLEHQAKEKSIRINVNIDDSVEQISGVQLSIEELITNLVGNAIQYSDHSSDINLRVKSLNGTVHIEVQDQGKGIPEQEQEKIFEEFYRGSKTRTTTEGTGLGLAISKKIVQAHGGKIWVESGESKGSKFCFTLPQDHPSQ
jgi:signal transduction histidine kinase